MSYRLTFLGCGPSGGVPRVANGWGACDPKNPKNRRRRSSVLIERIGTNHATTAVLIDTPPDVRDGLVEHNVERVDAVLFTHDHADHTHGIDDLRGFALRQKGRVPVYMDDPTYETLYLRFKYCFEQRPQSGYPSILKRHPLEPGMAVTISGPGGPLTLMPVLVDHGEMPALGFRVGGLMYTPDIVGIPDRSLPHFEGLSTWVVDALRPMPHGNHWSFGQALEALKQFRVPRGILTHMLHDLDFEATRQRCPAGVEPAYDGMVITFDGTASSPG